MKITVFLAALVTCLPMFPPKYQMKMSEAAIKEIINAILDASVGSRSFQALNTHLDMSGWHPPIPLLPSVHLGNPVLGHPVPLGYPTSQFSPTKGFTHFLPGPQVHPSQVHFSLAPTHQVDPRLFQSGAIQRPAHQNPPIRLHEISANEIPAYDPSSAVKWVPTPPGPAHFPHPSKSPFEHTKKVLKTSKKRKGIPKPRSGEGNEGKGKSIL